MARDQPSDDTQPRVIPVFLEHQLLQGTRAPAMPIVGEHRMDLSLFDDRYPNDETGGRAYDPKRLLQVVLLAYSRGGGATD
jgi:hypothetical protein